MAEAKSSRSGSRIRLKPAPYLIIIVLIIAISAMSAFAVMSDNSIHGLTLRFYGSVTRSCDMAGPIPVLSFVLPAVTVYSSASLTTSLTHVTFSLAADGVQVGIANGGDSSFDPGHSVAYSLTFNNPTLDPHSQPLTSQIALTVNAQVTAGLYSSPATASDSQLIHFSSPPC